MTATETLTITTGSRRTKPDLWPQLSAAPAHQWWTRVEPYFDDWLWASEPLFASKFRARRVIDETTGAFRTVRIPDYLDPAGQGRRAWARATTNPTIRRTMTALANLHTFSSGQLRAWTGMSAKNSAMWLKPLFDLGLTERGVYQASPMVAGKLPYLWSLNHTNERLRMWLDALTDVEARAVLGNDDRKAYRGSRHGRHNVLASEVALRMLEIQPAWTAVTGEPSSNPVALCGDEDADAQLLGDFTMWRSDGLRVVVELAASPDRRHMASKLARWADWLGRDTLESTGVIVVALAAYRREADRWGRQLRKLHSDVLDVGTMKVRGSVATPAQVRRARQRLLLATWADWFPSAHTISEAGVAGSCGWTANGDTFHAVNLTDLEYRGVAWPTDATTDAVTPPWAGGLPINGPS